MIDDILNHLQRLDDFAYGAHEASQNEAFYKIIMNLRVLMNFIKEERLKAKDAINGQTN